MPAPPVELDQVTCATPALSCAVPLTTIELADVATVVIAGDKMIMDGGAVVPPLPGLAGGVAGGLAGGLPPDELPGGLSAGGLGSWLVTVTLCDAWSCWASEALTVITLAPKLKGIAAVVQLDDPCAVPAAP